MSDSSEVGIIFKTTRSLFAGLNSGIYVILGAIYQIFFNIASSQLFENETIRNFYGRVQLIIGVFMLFKLTVSVLQGIVDPNKFTDAKNGFGNIITRIITALAMLTLLVPISIPGNDLNSYEVSVNNNGLLFGTLYSLQDRILSNNTLGRLILGTTDNNVSTEDQENTLASSANQFTSAILKGFIRINLKEKEERVDDDETNKRNYMCYDNENNKYYDDDTKKIIDYYNKLDADTTRLLDYASASCVTGSHGFLGLADTDRYVFTFNFLFSLVVGIVFIVILIGFCLDIAIRAIKLSILRLIAPIPIISYIDKKEGGAFSAWVKITTSTYLDLFLRLAIIYFVIFLIQDMIKNGLIINNASGLVGIVSMIFIWLGLFFFAKQAPKFIMDALGIKGDGNFKLFGGLGKLAGAATLAAGISGAAATNVRAYSEENPGAGLLKKMGSGAVGALGGLYRGGRALATSDKDYAGNTFKAMQDRNTLRANHSTLPGRIQDKVYGAFMGRSLAAKNQGIMDASKSAASSIKDFKGMAEGEARKKGDYGFYNGKHYNYEELVAAMNAKDASGNFSYKGERLNVGDFDANVLAKILDSQTARYLQSDFDGKKFGNGKLQTTWAQASYDMGEAGLSDELSSIISYMSEAANALNDVADAARLEGQYGRIGKAIGSANTQYTEQATSMQNIKYRANNQANKK